MMNNLLSSQTVMNNLTKQYDLTVTPKVILLQYSRKSLLKIFLGIEVLESGRLRNVS